MSSDTASIPSPQSTTTVTKRKRPLITSRPRKIVSVAPDSDTSTVTTEGTLAPQKSTKRATKPIAPKPPGKPRARKAINKTVDQPSPSLLSSEPTSDEPENDDTDDDQLSLFTILGLPELYAEVVKHLPRRDMLMLRLTCRDGARASAQAERYVRSNILVAGKVTFPLYQDKAAILERITESLQTSHIVSVGAPKGYGKTVTSLILALNHVSSHPSPLADPSLNGGTWSYTLGGPIRDYMDRVVMLVPDNCVSALLMILRQIAPTAVDWANPVDSPVCIVPTTRGRWYKPEKGRKGEVAMNLYCKNAINTGTWSSRNKVIIISGWHIISRPEVTNNCGEYGLLVVPFVGNMHFSASLLGTIYGRMTIKRMRADSQTGELREGYPEAVNAMDILSIMGDTADVSSLGMQPGGVVLFHATDDTTGLATTGCGNPVLGVVVKSLSVNLLIEKGVMRHEAIVSGMVPTPSSSRTPSSSSTSRYLIDTSFHSYGEGQNPMDLIIDAITNKGMKRIVIIGASQHYFTQAKDQLRELGVSVYKLAPNTPQRLAQYQSHDVVSRGPAILYVTVNAIGLLDAVDSPIMAERIIISYTHSTCIKDNILHVISRIETLVSDRPIHITACCATTLLYNKVAVRCIAAMWLGFLAYGVNVRFSSDLATTMTDLVLANSIKIEDISLDELLYALGPSDPRLQHVFERLDVFRKAIWAR